MTEERLAIQRERARLYAANKRAANLDAARAYEREWYAKNREAIRARKNSPKYKEAAQRRYERTKEHHVAVGKEWQKRNRRKVCGITKRWRDDNPDKVRCISLRKLYGITLADYNAMLARQEGSCAICGGLPAEGKRLHVDHCHATNKVRELLCGHCNRLLGCARDVPENADKAAAYLRKHGR